MDIRYFFDKKLAVLKEFYAKGKVPFDQSINEAERGYERWLHGVTGEDVDPAPPIELQDMYDSGKACKNLLGQAGLSALQQTFKEYLSECFSNRGCTREAEILISRLKKERIGWLRCYKKAFQDLLGCDWDNAPVPFSILEDVVLARNAIQHEGHISSLDRWQDTEYRSKYPASLFVDEIWPGLISVTESNLKLAMDSIERFVGWLETCR